MMWIIVNFRSWCWNQKRNRKNSSMPNKPSNWPKSASNATLAKARHLRASLAASKAGEVNGNGNGSSLTNRNGTPIPAREDPGQVAVDSANGLVA